MVTSTVEVWLHAFSIPGRVAELARRAEAWGFTGDREPGGLARDPHVRERLVVHCG
jgi:hypothetical protein